MISLANSRLSASKVPASHPLGVGKPSSSASAFAACLRPPSLSVCEPLARDCELSIGLPSLPDEHAASVSANTISTMAADETAAHDIDRTLDFFISISFPTAGLG